MAREATDKSKVSDSSPPSGVRLSTLGRIATPPRPMMKSVPPAPLWPAPRRPLSTPVPPPSSPFAELLPGRVVQPIPGAPQPPSILSPSKRKHTARFWPPAPGSQPSAIVAEVVDELEEDELPARSAQPPAPPVASAVVEAKVAAPPSLPAIAEDPIAPQRSSLAEIGEPRGSLASLADVLGWPSDAGAAPLTPEALRRRRIAYGVIAVLAVAALIELAVLVAG